MGDDEHLGPGDAGGDLARVERGCAQILGAGEQQRRHGRQRARGSGTRRGVRPALAFDDPPRMQRGRRVEGIEEAGRDRAQGGERFGVARRGGTGALPREARLLAGGCGEQRVALSEQQPRLRLLGRIVVGARQRRCGEQEHDGQGAQLEILDRRRVVGKRRDVS